MLTEMIISDEIWYPEQEQQKKIKDKLNVISNK